MSMSKIMILLSLLVEITYLISSVLLIIYIFIKKNKTSCGSTFWIIVMIYLITSLLAHPLIGIITTEHIEKILFRLSLYAEILFLLWVIFTVLQNKNSKIIFGILMILLIFILPETQYKGKISLNSDFQLFYALESILASTMAIFYFFELRSKLSEINLFENAHFLIMLGIFFCFFIQVNYNLAFLTYVTYEKTNFISEIAKDPIALNLSLFTYNITRFSLLLLTLFFYRSLKVDLKELSQLT